MIYCRANSWCCPFKWLVSKDYLIEQFHGEQDHSDITSQPASRPTNHTPNHFKTNSDWKEIFQTFQTQFTEYLQGTVSREIYLFGPWMFASGVNNWLNIWKGQSQEKYICLARECLPQALTIGWIFERDSLKRNIFVWPVNVCLRR